MRNTKQKQLILQIINNSTNHLNAFEVYEEARKSMPNISLGTVYRNLNMLVEEKNARRLKATNGIDRFDNTIGYELHNCVPCCGFCNFAKGKHTYQEFKNWIKDLVSFNS